MEKKKPGPVSPEVEAAKKAVYLDFDPAARAAYRRRQFGAAAFDDLLVVTHRLVREDRIAYELREDGFHHVAVNVLLIQELVRLARDLHPERKKKTAAARPAAAIQLPKPRPAPVSKEITRQKIGQAAQELEFAAERNPGADFGSAKALIEKARVEFRSLAMNGGEGRDFRPAYRFACDAIAAVQKTVLDTLVSEARRKAATLQGTDLGVEARIAEALKRPDYRQKRAALLELLRDLRAMGARDPAYTPPERPPKRSSPPPDTKPDGGEAEMDHLPPRPVTRPVSRPKPTRRDLDRMGRGEGRRPTHDESEPSHHGEFTFAPYARQHPNRHHVRHRAAAR